MRQFEEQVRRGREYLGDKIEKVDWERMDLQSVHECVLAQADSYINVWASFGHDTDAASEFMVSHGFAPGLATPYWNELKREWLRQYYSIDDSGTND